MKKIVLMTFSGIIGLFIGVGTGYLFLTSLNTSANYLFLILSLISIGGGGFLLYKVTNPKKVTDNSLKIIDIETKEVSSMLERNNQITSEWKKTNDKRDKLKMLEISTNAEKG